MKRVEVFTDGSCLGNPGPGGIGLLLRYNGYEKTLSQGFYQTTNNRMELRAVIVALSMLKEPCHVILHSDSQYMKNGIEKWIFNWKRNNWQTSDKKPVKNQDLWLALEEVSKKHKLDWQWVKGHTGHRENEICDELAKQGANQPTQADEGYKP